MLKRSLLLLASFAASCSASHADNESVVVGGHMRMFDPSDTCSPGQANATIASCKQAIAERQRLLENLKPQREQGEPISDIEDKRRRLEQEIAGDAKVIEQIETQSDCWANRVKVDILADNTFRWNGNSVADLGALDEKFADLSRRNTCPAAEIIPSQAVSYQQVARVMILMQKQGVWSGLAGNMRQD